MEAMLAIRMVVTKIMGMVALVIVAVVIMDTEIISAVDTVV
jgi:hypothetical protein